MIDLKSTNILGTKITTSSEDIILEYIQKILSEKSTKAYITTPNPEIIMYSRNHKEFQKILNEAEIALPDGVGVTLCAYFMGKGKIVRITGVDFMEKLCKRLAKSPYSIGFFGGQTDIAELTAECLKKKYSGLKVSYASNTWDDAKIKGKNIDILFVAMGYPKQEEWIYDNLDKIPVKIAMGVGGAFDFISGKVPRAPHFLRTFGLEWSYRLVIQPWRWKRQLVLISFIIFTFQEVLRTRFRKVT